MKRNAKQMFRVTIKFTGGNLKGLTHETTQDWPRKVGQRVPAGLGSPYVVVSCDPIA